ncbi:MAG TPA: hypothetical protein VLY24_01000 [Bryobacteraceae bacterium]|jgi:hypothetical protein|nr:hypothetical protein [Bryobacteraceae bacterium]
MGLTYHDASRLFEARCAGASFENTLTLGRLKLFLHSHELRALRSRYQAFTQTAATPLRSYEFGQYSDDFWTEFLGARHVTTMDYSDYEGATLVHDMNQPVPEQFHQQFDAVIDAGSLEHIFNFPTAIRNLMLMTKVGGMVFATTVANNLCGHGFYQFSPELMYRIFSEENGFEPPRVVLLEGVYPAVELRPMRGAYRVIDPAEAGERVCLQNTKPVMIMVDAKKKRHVVPFQSAPQQSDYVVAWNGKNGATRTGLRRVLDSLPRWCQQEIRGFRYKRQSSFRNSRFYRKLAQQSSEMKPSAKTG